MSLTLLDEFRKPFWCISSPVFLKPENVSASYDYDGDHFQIHYSHPDGLVKIGLVWLMEQKQFVVISLKIYVSVSKVNEHFHREYWTPRCSGKISVVVVFSHSGLFWTVWNYCVLSPKSGPDLSVQLLILNQVLLHKTLIVRHTPQFSFYLVFFVNIQSSNVFFIVHFYLCRATGT